MPMLQPYVGDLEQYNPNPSSGFDMKALTDTWLQARAIKENRMKQDRDKQILEAIMRGDEEIPVAAPQAQPQGMMGRLGEFMTGGRPNVGPSSLETATVEAKMKNMFISPTDELIKKGQAATAEKAIYDAGGPRPSLFGNVPAAPTSDQQLPLILQNAPPGIQKQITAEQPASPAIPQVGQYYPPELDEFGRPKGFKMKEQTVEDKKFAIEQEKTKKVEKKAVDLLRTSAQDTINTILEIKKGLKYFGAAGDIGPWPAEYAKKNWRSNFDKLKDKLVVDLMLRLKDASATGSTGFGQLSEKEGMRLENATTALKKGLSEPDASRYLKEIEDVAEKVLTETTSQNSGGKTGGVIMQDASGNKAMVFPDGSFKELK